MVQNSSFLRIREETCCHWCVREEDECDEADDDSETAQEDKHDPPTGKGRIDLLKTVTDDAADDLADS